MDTHFSCYLFYFIFFLLLFIKEYIPQDEEEQSEFGDVEKYGIVEVAGKQLTVNVGDNLFALHHIGETFYLHWMIL